MKISKKSWHYRFNKHVQNDFSWRMSREVVTTCSYVRTTLVSFIVEALTLMLMGCFFFMLLAMAAMMFAAPVASLLGFFIPSEVLGGALTCWIAVGATTTIALVYHLTVFIEKRINIHNENKQTLLRQTLQDRKNGICTIIELED